MTDRLARLGWRVIRYDHRGIGASGRDVEEVGLDARVRDLSAVVDHPAVKKSLGLVAFIVMVLSLLATLVRPRLPGSEMSRPEVTAIPIQIVLAVLAFRCYRR